MKNHITLPCCERLLRDPQLAVLAVLEAATSAATRAIRAAHPELHDLDISRHSDPLADAALHVLDLARALAISLHQYDRALREAYAREDHLLPF
jgi:hypothetical protein